LLPALQLAVGDGRAAMSVLQNLRQSHLDWLIDQGVRAMAIVSPVPVMLARGTRAPDGRFEPDDDGKVWFAFRERTDTVFWRPRTGEIAVDTGRCFAMGGDVIDNPGVTALGAWLRIFASPLEWLQANRSGIYVLPDRWVWCFEMLRDVERVAVSEEVLALYTRHMKPRLPELAVIPKTKTEARAA
jgi:hypothetical protein